MRQIGVEVVGFVQVFARPLFAVYKPRNVLRKFRNDLLTPAWEVLLALDTNPFCLWCNYYHAIGF